MGEGGRELGNVIIPLRGTLLCLASRRRLILHGRAPLYPLLMSGSLNPIGRRAYGRARLIFGTTLPIPRPISGYRAASHKRRIPAGLLCRVGHRSSSSIHSHSRGRFLRPAHSCTIQRESECVCSYGAVLLPRRSAGWGGGKTFHLQHQQPRSTLIYLCPGLLLGRFWAVGIT